MVSVFEQMNVKILKLLQVSLWIFTVEPNACEIVATHSHKLLMTFSVLTNFEFGFLIRFP